GTINRSLDTHRRPDERGAMVDGAVSDGEVLQAVAAVAEAFAAQRAERQTRTALDVGDFDRLADAGLLRTGLPGERGGMWQSVAASSRPICEVFRTLAAGDPSVALVASMHPAVLAFWLATVEAP